MAIVTSRDGGAAIAVVVPENQVLPLFNRSYGIAVVGHVSFGVNTLSSRRVGKIPVSLVAGLPSQRGVIRECQLNGRGTPKAKNVRGVLSGSDGESVCNRLCCYTY